MKNEIPAIDEKAEETLAILNQVRDTIDGMHHRGREPITTEQYAHLCELLYMASESLWAIRSMATDHHCGVNPLPLPPHLRRPLVVLPGGARSRET